MDEEGAYMRALVVGNNRAFENKVLTCLKRHPDIEVVGVVGDSKEGVRLAKQLRAELVITQFDMPDMTGLALTRALKDSDIPPPAVVIVSWTDKPHEGQLAYQAGADGYLARTTLGQLEPLVEKLTELQD